MGGRRAVGLAGTVAGLVHATVASGSGGDMDGSRPGQSKGGQGSDMSGVGSIGMAAGLVHATVPVGLGSGLGMDGGVFVPVAVWDDSHGFWWMDGGTEFSEYCVEVDGVELGAGLVVVAAGDGRHVVSVGDGSSVVDDPFLVEGMTGPLSPLFGRGSGESGSREFHFETTGASVVVVLWTCSFGFVLHTGVGFRHALWL